MKDQSSAHRVYGSCVVIIYHERDRRGSDGISRVESEFKQKFLSLKIQPVSIN